MTTPSYTGEAKQIVPQLGGRARACTLNCCPCFPGQAEMGRMLQSLAHVSRLLQKCQTWMELLPPPTVWH